MVLKLYYDLMSQPSRVLYILLKHSKYPFESVPVDLRRGAHFSDSYTKVNRFQKVPVIDHNGFVLTESIAIVRYLAREQIIPESLYPCGNKNQAQVDEYLGWQHIGLRLHTSMYFRVKYLDPVLAGTEPDPDRVTQFEKRMITALEDMETKWLNRGMKYLVSDSITVADLFAACELEQPRMAGYDVSTKYPQIASWLLQVKDYFNPHYDEAHITLNKIVKNYETKYGTKAQSHL